MVEKWKKDLKKVSRNFGKKDLEKIIEDIIEDNYHNYDFKFLSGYNNLIRIRIGNYRIIFKLENDDNKIILFGKRGDVYKALKNMKL